MNIEQLAFKLMKDLEGRKVEVHPFCACPDCEAARNKEANEEWPAERLTQHTALLKDRMERMIMYGEGDFELGDIVQWRDGLRNKNIPEYGEPVIVTSVRSGQVNERAPITSCEFQEPCDLQCGRIGNDGEFELFWMDSRRMTRVSNKDDK